jgi:chaperonin GroES
MLRKIAQACGQELQFSVHSLPERFVPAARPATHATTFRGMHFRPLHDRIVVRRVAPEFRTTGGIIIPNAAQEKPMEGEVIAVGPGNRNEQGELVPIAIAAGERILFGKWSGTEVKLDGEEFLIMKESDIIGVVGTPARNQKKTRAV